MADHGDVRRVDTCFWGFKEGMSKEAFLHLVCHKPAQKWLALDHYDPEIVGYCKAHFVKRMATHQTLVGIVGMVDVFAPVVQIREVTRNEATVWEVMRT